MNYIKPEQIKAYVEQNPEGIAGMSEDLATMVNHFVTAAVTECMEVFSKDLPDPTRQVMQSKEEIITGMCYTWRHDYGLTKQPDDTFVGSITAGMTGLERQSLYKQMEQLYTHHIQPLVEEINQIKNILELKRERTIN